MDEHWYERDDVFDRVIEVPFPPESPASGIGNRDFHPVVWYRRVVPGRAASRTSGCCCTSAPSTTGRRSGSTGGSSPSTRAATPRSPRTSPTRCVDDGEQVVVVRAEDPTRRPRPSRAASRTGSARRTASGTTAPPASGSRSGWSGARRPTSTRSRWTPDLRRGQVTLEASSSSGVPVDGACRSTVTPAPRPARCRRGPVRVVDHERSASSSSRTRGTASSAASCSGRRSTRTSSTPGSRCRADGDGARRGHAATSGSAASPCGGGRFLLNGRPYYLRLVLEQGYWPESHLAAPDDDALRAEVELVKALGFNGVRIHQKIEDPRFLVLVRPARPAGLGGDAQRLCASRRTAVQRLDQEWIEVVAPRPQPPVHRHVGAAQRELGRAEPRPRRRAAARAARSTT